MEACDQIIAKAKMRAAKLLEAIDTKIEYSDGLFKAPASNRTIDIFAAAVHEFGELSATVDIGHRLPAHPTGCAVCELEVDPETGQVEIQRYTSIDDVGQPINPLIVDGQIHGAIAQGVGQALYEGLATDDMGQVISASFMDYALPHALNLTNFDIELAEDPTLGNPLRVKGGGEGGITPATAAIINALVDALSEHGIEHMDMPATSQRVWHALQMRTADHT
jgi:carbon-monoxide dehydrogenase large subunit